MSNSKITKRVVGAAGAAVALTAGVGLMTATPAHADVWDNVAQCESSGNWSTNTGNGFSGGLQFTQQTWNANGGSGSASNASKSEQKRVARNVLKTQGPGAWPVCGAKAGLSRSNGGSNSGSSSNYSSNSNSGSSNNYSSKKSNGSSNYSSNNNYSSNKSSNYSSNNGSSNYSSNNGSSNYSSNNGSSNYSSNNGSSNYTAQRSTGTYSSESTPALPKHSYKGTGEHVTIKSGDTLAKIASEHNVKGGWTALWSINSSTISNPNVILAGATIEL